MSYSMKSMYSGTAGAGAHPTVGMTSGGLIIAAWASTASSNLYVRLGQASDDLTSVAWGAQAKYDGGKSCAVAINDQKIAVGVHESDGGYLYWKVGVAGTDAAGLPSVSWINAAKFTGGCNARIAINDSGKVVIVWSSTNSTNLYCLVGQVDTQTYKLVFGDSIQYDAGLHPTVSINNDGDVIFGHASSASTKLYYQLATAGVVDGKHTLTSIKPVVNYDNGDQNCLALDNKGVTWEVHRSSESGALYFAAAQLLPGLSLSPAAMSRCAYPAQKSSTAWISMPGSSDAETVGVLVTLGDDNHVDVSIWQLLGIPSVSFNELTPPTGYSATLFGGMVGTETVGPYVLGTDLGDFDGHPDGAVYFLGVPGMGTASVSVKPTSNGQYQVFLNADDSRSLLCNSQDALSIRIDAAGVVSLSDAAGNITGALISTMMDSGNLLKGMVEMVSGSPALQAQWSVSAMDTLYSMGLSPTIMTNMNSVCTYTPDCCMQLSALLQSVQFGTSQRSAQPPALQSESDTWACWGCRTAIWSAVNVAIVISAVYVVPALEAEVAAAVIVDTLVGAGYLSDCIIALSRVVAGITENQLATNIVTAISVYGFEGVLDNVATTTCTQLGVCS